MALSGKLIGYVEISKTGDVFHDLLRHNPHELSAMFPDTVHGCDLHEGDRGAVGSVVTWHYTLDGKKKFDKDIIEEVDEKNHKIVFKVIEGELLEDKYKSFTATFHVEPKGDGQVASWTFDFEKSDTSVPYPTTLMDFLCKLITELDARDNTK